MAKGWDFGEAGVEEEGERREATAVDHHHELGAVDGKVRQVT